MKLEQLKAVKKTIGAKQTMKGVERGEVEYVFIGHDSDGFVTEPILTLCAAHHIPVNRDHTMAELGKAANIKVKAAAVGVLK